MLNLRARMLFELSRRRMRPAPTRQVDYDAYGAWRLESLSRSLAAFDGASLAGKDVLDFGCGDGQLAQFVALERHPHRVVGVDVDDAALARAQAAVSAIQIPGGTTVEFVSAGATSIPVPDASFDTILAFDCLEHIMAPAAVLREWHRILRPGGRCLIEWFPFKGPWGPHMEALIPIPWAHVVFGQRAMFRVAEEIYDLPEFVPRHWDLDEVGRKKPNKWRA